MKQRLQRKLKILVGLAILAMAVAWIGQPVPSSHAAVANSPAGVSAPVALDSPGEQGFARVAHAVTPAVVNITRSWGARPRDAREFRDRKEDFFRFPRSPHGPMDPRLEPREPRGGGMGSGVIVSPDGYIVTNNHVVQGASELMVTLPDKREFEAKVIGTDPKTDLAVIKVDARDLPYVRWGDSLKVQVGDYVLAIGNPFGLNSTVTLGIVSALGRGRMGITQYEDFIQTDAAINPGNSGGALVNVRGELIGINTAIVSRTGGYQGVGFAVPVTMAKPIYESLRETGRVVRGYLGVGIQDVTQDLAELFSLEESKGVLVSDVAEESPAGRGGLKRGDVIVGYREMPVEDAVSLQQMVTRTPIGTEAPIKVVRDGREKNLTVKIGEHPDAMKVARAEHQGSTSALAGVLVREVETQIGRDLGLNRKTRGVVVTSVLPGSGADRAGLSRGDVIREINRQPITSLQDYEQLIAGLEEDQRVLLLINRRGASLFLTVKV